jgi:dTMP kinase
MLIAFEGLDQSGKETQAKRLQEWLRGTGRHAEYVTFPDYTTPIGKEIYAALHGERTFGPDVIQLLFIANRHELKPQIERAIADRVTVLCDRYLASSIAYGEAQGLDPVWMEQTQRFLPQPQLTILLDIRPATAANRKSVGRDRFERDLALLAAVRQSYLRQAAQPSWVRIDGERDPEAVAADVHEAVTSRLALR